MSGMAILRKIDGYLLIELIQYGLHVWVCMPINERRLNHLFALCTQSLCALLIADCTAMLFAYIWRTFIKTWLYLIVPPLQQGRGVCAVDQGSLDLCSLQQNSWCDDLILCGRRTILLCWTSPQALITYIAFNRLVSIYIYGYVGKFFNQITTLPLWNFQIGVIKLFKKGFIIFIK